MNIEKIEIKGYYVWVDKDGEDYKFHHVTGIRIIAASPELGLDVPTYVEWLANIDSKNHYKDQSDYWAIGYDSFKRGYQTAEKELFTEDDVRKAILKSFLLGVEREQYSKEIEDEIVEGLKKSKP